MKEASFRQWLLQRDYADADDLATLDGWLNHLSPKIQFHIRPGHRILRTWHLQDAVSLDGKGEFTAEVRQAINQILATLEEPKLGAAHSRTVQ